MSRTELKSRTKQLFAERLDSIHRQTDRAFVVLFVVQWVFAVGVTLAVSPHTWVGDTSYPHVHLWAALLVGGALTIAPIICVSLRPGTLATRLVVATAQVGYSTLLIHLTGGRIESHFHIFGSLAFLSFYRDWRVIVPAMLIVAADHVLRAIFWPESIFGVVVAAPWRALEHIGWVVFEGVFLLWGCKTNTRELRDRAEAQAELERAKATVEEEVEQRTRELLNRTQELEEWVQRSNALEDQLGEAQKLEAIGQLSAGVAHEINTPMQYMSDNIEFLSDCSARLFEVVDVYHDQLENRDNPLSWQQRISAVKAACERCRYDYIREQIPHAIEESLEGVRRVIEIVRAMKQMSHPGTQEMTPTDINEAVRTTALLCKNRWKYAAELELFLADDLPEVPAFTNEINQVLVNLLVNAADAIVDKNGDSGELGKMVVRTRRSGDWVQIDVQDDGCGMDEVVRRRIFDPFYTTKEVGKGTGQGLAISYNVVVNHHQGRIDLSSEPGAGTCFTVELPLGEHPDLMDADKLEEKDPAAELSSKPVAPLDALPDETSDLPPAPVILI
ncbi:C4-dicarboxylate transport sensor protein DctB [Pseudobythopirellula maris]|uniref:histidine kinase n=1 Tax=Pseudobythopirellula maris TaxID=2527991 RepID=A0A5C5ZME3_9BACT|nr:ATP-binding protein [Pseudobythopirellula maris]TWT88157.1 C4-dicarboxylate transport sensor protein DctB [Pseudobythopirellula maris]